MLWERDGVDDILGVCLCLLDIQFITDLFPMHSSLERIGFGLDFDFGVIKLLQGGREGGIENRGDLESLRFVDLVLPSLNTEHRILHTYPAQSIYIFTPQ